MKNLGKGLEFNPRVAFMFLGALVMLGFGCYGMAFWVNSGPSKAQASQEVVVSTLEPIVITVVPTIEPSPTQVVLAVVAECDVLEYPEQGSRALGRLISGSVVVPVGRWFAWVRIPEGWISEYCFQGVPPLSAVSPPVMPPKPTDTPTPTDTPAPTDTPTPYIPPMRSIPSLPTREPTAVPSPTPVFSGSALPAGFNPGWCVKLAGVKGVWLPDGSYLAAKDGFLHLSVDVLGLPLVFERGLGYIEYTFNQCGIYK